MDYLREVIIVPDFKKSYEDYKNKLLKKEETKKKLISDIKLAFQENLCRSIIDELNKNFSISNYYLNEGSCRIGNYSYFEEKNCIFVKVYFDNFEDYSFKISCSHYEYECLKEGDKDYYFDTTEELKIVKNFLKEIPDIEITKDKIQIKNYSN
jgi:hypothetical protein